MLTNDRPPASHRSRQRIGAPCEKLSEESTCRQRSRAAPNVGRLVNRSIERPMVRLYRCAVSQSNDRAEIVEPLHDSGTVKRATRRRQRGAREKSNDTVKMYRDFAPDFAEPPSLVASDTPRSHGVIDDRAALPGHPYGEILGECRSRMRYQVIGKIFDGCTLADGDFSFASGRLVGCPINLTGGRCRQYHVRIRPENYLRAETVAAKDSATRIQQHHV